MVCFSFRIWIHRQRIFLIKSANKRKTNVPQLVQLRLYSRAQYALCGCQHCEAPDPKQRSFLCKSLGWQASGLLRVPWPLLWLRFLKLNCFPVTFVHLLSKTLNASLVFSIRSHSWGASFPHFVHSIQCHALSKEGPTSWMDAAYWICSFATWRRTNFMVSCSFLEYWHWYSVLKLQ